MTKLISSAIEMDGELTWTHIVVKYNDNGTTKVERVPLNGRQNTQTKAKSVRAEVRRLRAQVG